MRFFFSIPLSVPQKERIDWVGRPHTGKPDISNLIKFVEDSLNEVLWTDDKLIFRYDQTYKVYSYHPRTEIEIFPQTAMAEKEELGVQYEEEKLQATGTDSD